MSRELKTASSPIVPMLESGEELIVLPKRPKNFDFVVGYGCKAQEIIPSNVRDHSAFLCQTDWPWSQKSDCLNSYSLYEGKIEWSLWSNYWDQRIKNWQDVCIGTVNRRGVNQKQAAIYLLLEFWKYDAVENNTSEFHWVNQEGYLIGPELDAIAREIWQ